MTSEKTKTTQQTKTENVEPENVEVDPEARIAQAREMIHKRVMAAAGVGLVPIPIVDLAGLTGIQLEMLSRLSKMYNIPFRKDIGKSLIGSLLGSALPVWALPPAASLIKAIPIIGQTTGAVSMSILGGAATYAIGQVFLQHFESGGTFLDFYPESVKEYFAEQFKKGEKVASETAGSSGGSSNK